MEASTPLDVPPKNGVRVIFVPIKKELDREYRNQLTAWASYPPSANLFHIPEGAYLAGAKAKVYAQLVLIRSCPRAESESRRAKIAKRKGYAVVYESGECRSKAKKLLGRFPSTAACAKAAFAVALAAGKVAPVLPPFRRTPNAAQKKAAALKAAAVPRAARAKAELEAAHQAQHFSHGRDGRCFWEQTTDECAKDGFRENTMDFYRLIADSQRFVQSVV